ncbi:hypothetical protein B0T26DRAFT_700041 [Lasiosphaeria miniovina]|uniref:Uncharacterized protein n=1 Tax=Lasiosphaeria miniovina TaxID=1954250 RepID=A0AA40E3Y3_9PEZI|nr:uncharacterized protein B0T26DRAFT_700041 [Lasiosphaeria miniovina]KAK0721683.1 hypothetical protein B0T26DRAFT_700041 [Lasiosphaeria miniovina]
MLRRCERAQHSHESNCPREGAKVSQLHSQLVSSYPPAFFCNQSDLLPSDDTMESALISWITGEKRMPRQIPTTSTLVGGRVASAQKVVKTVRAVHGHGIFRVGETINSVNQVSKTLNNFIPKVSKLVDRANQFIPTMQIMAHSACDSIKITTSFTNVATSVGIGANLVLTYQGVKALHLIAAKLEDVAAALAAQTALTAQRDFPQYVYDMIRERLGQTSDDPAGDHWFFLLHPDDDWYPKFYHLLETQPVGPRFCGYTNHIDTIFVFMLAARRFIEERERRAREAGRQFRPVRLHLLIPAYQPILIAEALRIPPEIGDFVMEARVNSGKEFVWLNLPHGQRHHTSGIGHWEPPGTGWWEGVLSKIGLAQRPLTLGSPRVLGSRQRSSEDDDVLAMVGDGEFRARPVADGEPGNEDLLGPQTSNQGGDGGGGGGENRHHATPLHHRHGRRDHRRSVKEIDRGSRGEKGPAAAAAAGLRES